jgi:sulfate/thiosulfate transport system ATP-binding protein
MSIQLENISKYYGQQVVVNNVSLEIRDGEFFVLLGSSGSGKTTILNIIAGLVQPEKGKVFLHGRDVTDVPTQKRRVGFVFQNYALFQYMNVAQNIEFGLEVQKLPRAQRESKRDELLELVGLVGLGGRMPSQLSGGQQQRVALARALAVEPEVLLFDEPLGALDAKIRAELRRSLKRIQQKSGVAAILVTHDQEEAFDLGDRIGVMNYGRLIEVGTPRELYENPKTEYVASFLGSANLLLGQIQGEKIRIGEQSFPIPSITLDLASSDRAQVLFRPEDVDLALNAVDLTSSPLGKGQIIAKEFKGTHEHLRVALPAIQGVRSISPIVPYGNPGFIMEVNRPPEQSAALPLKVGDDAVVGVRRMHVLSHPGMNFLLVTDGSLRSQSAITMGGYMARMAHAKVLMLGIGENKSKLENYLLEARKQIGSGMASLQVQASIEPFSTAISQAGEQQDFDLLIFGWRPAAGYGQLVNALGSGDHHLFLATQPLSRLSKALICLASGEPGKDTVVFAGRLLRHMGAEATLMTVLPESRRRDLPESRIDRFLKDGQQSLARFGVPANTIIKTGGLLPAIQEEMQTEHYDLVVLGAPLPDRHGQVDLGQSIGPILSSVENCSFLIIQSRYYRRLHHQLRREI